MTNGVEHLHQFASPGMKESGSSSRPSRRMLSHSNDNAVTAPAHDISKRGYMSNLIQGRTKKLVKVMFNGAGFVAFIKSVLVVRAMKNVVNGLGNVDGKFFHEICHIDISGGSGSDIGLGVVIESHDGMIVIGNVAVSPMVGQIATVR